MNKKWNFLIIALLLFVVFSPDLFAGDLNNFPSYTMDKFDQIIKSFYDPIKGPAKWLFVTLGLIQMVITFGFMFMRQEMDIGVVMAALIRFMLFYGLFLAIFDHPDWMKKIFNGFTELANRATHGNVSSLDKVVENISHMWWFIWAKIQNNGWKHIPESLTLVAIGAIETIVVAILVGIALMTYAFFVFSLYVGVFWLGFGSFEYTRPWAINSVVNIIRWGAKWFMQLLIISVTFTIVDQMMVDAWSDLFDYITLVIVSLMMITVAFGTNGFVDSYFNGHGGGDNSVGVQMAQAFVSNSIRNVSRGAQQGASAGYSSVKEAVAAGGNTGGKGSAIKTAFKATGGAAIGAAAGMAAGGIRSFTGGTSSNVGQSSGAMATKVVGGTIQAVANASKGMVKIATGGSTTSSGTNGGQTSTKDRTGFDMSQLKSESGSSTGEIKGA